jgi:hypothetical protein
MNPMVNIKTGTMPITRNIIVAYQEIMIEEVDANK